MVRGLSTYLVSGVPIQGHIGKWGAYPGAYTWLSSTHPSWDLCVYAVNSILKKPYLLTWWNTNVVENERKFAINCFFCSFVLDQKLISI